MSLSRIVDRPPSGPQPDHGRHRRRRLVVGLAVLTVAGSMTATATAQASSTAQAASTALGSTAQAASTAHGTSTAQATPAAKATVKPSGHHSREPNFGPNVKIFDPSMPLSRIQATVDAVAAQQLG